MPSNAGMANRQGLDLAVKSVSIRTADNAHTAGNHNCTIRRRARNIVICWSAVVVHRTQPYSIPQKKHGIPRGGGFKPHPLPRNSEVLTKSNRIAN